MQHSWINRINLLRPVHFDIKGMRPNNIRLLYDSIGTSTTWVPPHPMWVACHACHMVDWDSTSLIATFSDIWIFILPRMEAFALATGLATWLAFALGKTAVLSRLIYSHLARKLVSQTYGKYQRCACRSQNGRHKQLCKELLARESGVTKDYRPCRPIASEFVSVEESCTQITANSFKCDGRCYQILHGIPYIDIYIVYHRYSFVSDSSPSQTYKQYTSCTDTISNPTVK